MPRAIQAVLCILLSCTVIHAQVPGGYELIRVTDSPEFDRWPEVNRHAQVVYATRALPDWAYTADIFLYEDGVTTRLTNDDIRDEFPDINDAGTIVWSRGTGSNGTCEIVMLQDGVLTQLTDNDVDDLTPRINDRGHVVWAEASGLACSGFNINLYDGHTTLRVSDNRYSNQSPRLNDLDAVVWTQFDFCQSPWSSSIKLWRAGLTETLTDVQQQPANPDIRNDQTVGWFYRDPDGDHALQLWRDGITSTLSTWGTAPLFNDAGDIAFYRWHNDSATWQVWLWRDERYLRLTNTPLWHYLGSLSLNGDVAYVEGNYPEGDIWLLRRKPIGDLNCDGLVNSFDLDPFVLALTDMSRYASAFPACDRLLADVNRDSVVNNFDIDAFVHLMIGEP